MAKKSISIEESLRRLEQIVELLEGDETHLSEAIKLYEEGTNLASTCRKELEKAELKVTKLQTTISGEVDEEDFSIE